MLQEISNKTILWLVLTSVVSGFIGASLKFIFDILLSNKQKKYYEAKEALYNHSFPLYQSAKSLNSRLYLLITSEENRALYNQRANGYTLYQLSTLYAFCHFLGESVIIQNTALLKIFRINKKTKKFYVAFYNVFKGMSSMYYFKGVEEVEGEYEKSTLPNNVLVAIGSLMLKKNTNDSKEQCVVEFHEFINMLETDEKFKHWVKYVDDFLVNTPKDIHRQDWNRLVLIGIHMRILEAYLDRKQRFSVRKDPKEFFNEMHPVVKGHFKYDLDGLVQYKIIDKKAFKAFHEEMSV